MNTPIERPTFVLVWPDGTTTLDSPDSNRESGLMTYLTGLQYGHIDEPLSAVYVVKTGEPDLEKAHHLGGWLQQVTIQYTGTETEADDWLYVTYTVSELNPSLAVSPDGTVRDPKAVVSNVITTITIRVDGRA